MKPHPRIRKTIKWGGLAVTVLLVVVTIVSLVAPFEWRTRYGPWLSELGGATSLYYPRFQITAAAERGFFWKRPDGLELWFTTGDDGSGRWVGASNWILLVLSLVPTVLAWHLDTLARRRARMNFCPKCNYDRTGLAKNAKCPESGNSGRVPSAGG